MRYPIILLDNGHGKETTGKRSPDGRLLEWKWTREIARSLRDDLQDRGYNVFLVCPEDIDVPLSIRAKRVNAYCTQYGKKNVLLISIHINASGNTMEWREPSGWTAYTTVGLTSSDDLARCLYDAAESELEDRMIRKYNHDKEPDFEENFYILRNTSCAAVLTENFFMDNNQDAEFLQSETGKKTVVRVHVKGILKYIKQFYQ